MCPSHYVEHRPSIDGASFDGLGKKGVKHVSGVVDRALTLRNKAKSGGPKRKSWNGGRWAKGGSKPSGLRIEHQMVPLKGAETTAAAEEIAIALGRGISREWL